MRIDVDVRTNPPDLLARLGRTQQATVAVDGVVKAVAHRLAFHAKRGAPYTTGALRRSVVPHQLRLTEWEVVAVGSEEKPYAAYMEFGTRPHWPPREAIENWVRIKLNIHSASEIRRVAYLVSRAIARRGLAPRYYMKQAFETISSVLKGLVARHLPKIIRAITGR